MSWRIIPEAHKAIRFRKGNSQWQLFWRWFDHKCWDGKAYGLTYCDGYTNNMPEVKEAIRRLSIADPREFDARERRLMTCANLSFKNQVIPKEQQIKYEEDNFYLEPYLSEIEEEKMQQNAAFGKTVPWVYRGKWGA